MSAAVVSQGDRREIWLDDHQDPDRRLKERPRGFNGFTVEQVRIVDDERGDGTGINTPVEGASGLRSRATPPPCSRRPANSLHDRKPPVAARAVVRFV
jgi:hypothetical protein